MEESLEKYLVNMVAGEDGATDPDPSESMRSTFSQKFQEMDKSRSKRDERLQNHPSDEMLSPRLPQSQLNIHSPQSEMMTSKPRRKK